MSISQRPNRCDAARRLLLPSVAGRGGAAPVSSLGSRLQPAQHALDAGQQLAQIEGLGDVVVRAELEADHAVHHVAGRRHHDDADVVVLPQVARQHQPVLAGHADIEEDDVGKLALDLLAHLGAGVGDARRRSVAAEILAQHRAHRRVIVDDQQASAAVHAEICAALQAGGLSNTKQ